MPAYRYRSPILAVTQGTWVCSLAKMPKTESVRLPSAPRQDSLCVVRLPECPYRRRSLMVKGGQFTPESDSPASPANWNRVVHTLRKAQVQSISCDQLISAAESGTAVIDVRPHGEYEAGFIEGSVNIPLYDLIEGWSAMKIATRIGYLAFGVLNGTEINERFFDEVGSVVAEEDGVILVCGQGGDLSQISGSAPMLPSRSLIAAHELVSNGYKYVRVLRPGAKGWEAEGRDMLMLADE